MGKIKSDHFCLLKGANSVNINQSNAIGCPFDVVQAACQSWGVDVRNAL